MPDELAFTYRKLEVDDVESVRNVARISWETTYAEVYDPGFIRDFIEANYSLESLRQIASIVALGERIFEVALQASRIVGFCDLFERQDEFVLGRM